MNFDRSGFILYVEAYEACVEFYANILRLPIMFDTDALTCFAFGGSYLMVELDDRPNVSEKSPPGSEPICLRMNVSDVKSLAEQLKGAKVEVDYQEHSWGTVAKFHDPDGNLCAFKDSQGFDKQIQEYLAKNS